MCPLWIVEIPREMVLSDVRNLQDDVFFQNVIYTLIIVTVVYETMINLAEVLMKSLRTSKNR